MVFDINLLFLELWHILCYPLLHFSFEVTDLLNVFDTIRESIPAGNTPVDEGSSVQSES